MFSKLSVFSSLALLAVATAMPQGVSQCNTGSMQCCNSVQNVDLTTLGQLGGLIGINVQGIAATVGLTCSGISVSASLSLFVNIDSSLTNCLQQVIGVGGGSGCNASPVCCSGVGFSSCSKHRPACTQLD